MYLLFEPDTRFIKKGSFPALCWKNKNDDPSSRARLGPQGRILLTQPHSAARIVLASASLLNADDILWPQQKPSVAKLTEIRPEVGLYILVSDTHVLSSL